MLENISKLESDNMVSVPRSRNSTLKKYVEAEHQLVEDYKNNGETSLVPPERKTSDLTVYSIAERQLVADDNTAKIYAEDANKLVERTLAYLKSTGIAETEEELESLAARSAAIHYDGDVTVELEKVRVAKDALDKATETMNKQRTAMSATIKRVTDAELAILDLERVNKRILNACLYEKNKQTRNRMLLTKLDNESKLVELRALVKKTKKDNAKGFEALEAMRKEVDSRQILHR